jgi:predicted PurR-regulated permease PerM
MAHTLYTVAALVVVVAGMRVASPIIVPFLVSVFLAVVSAPAVRWLQERGLPMWLALSLVSLGIAILSLGIIALIGGSVNDLSQKVPEYRDQLLALKIRCIDWLEEHGVNVKKPAEQEGLDPSRLFGFLTSTVNGLSGVFGNIVLILLTVVLLLIEASTLPAKLRAMPGDMEARSRRLATITEDIRRYMVIKTWVSLLTGGLVVLLLLVIGVDYALMWGLLAFLLHFVPNIGSLIAAVPAVLLALLQLGVAPAIFVALGYLVISSVIGNWVEPRIMGRGLGLSTLVVFVSLVFWGWVLGPVGMVLSVPLTVIVKIYLESSEKTRWMAVMLGNEA